VLFFHNAILIIGNQWIKEILERFFQIFQENLSELESFFLYLQKVTQQLYNDYTMQR